MSDSFEVIVTPEALDDARKVLGLPPHDGPENLLAQDSQFFTDCRTRHGQGVWAAALREVKK